jgi:arylformamidase
MAEPFDWQREYSPSSMIGGDLGPILDDWRQRSAEVAARHRVEQRPNGSLLVRSTEPSAPLAVFVHGGYWKALSAAESLFMAPHALAAGCSFLAVEYTIAPAGSIPQMITETAAALVDAGQLAERVTVMGHSAGAHLVAMAALVAPEPVPIDGTVLVSGIYDCRHVLHIDVNEVVHLDAASAAALSPMLHPLTASPAVAVMCGEIETNSFRTMSRQFADHCAVPYREVAARHHFDVVEDDAVLSAWCRR